MRRAVLAAAVIAACGNNHRVSPPPPEPGSAAVTAADAGVDAPSLDQDLPRLAARAVKLYAELATAFAAAGEDCAVATAKLGELTRVYGDVVAASAKVHHDGRGLQLKIALREHDAELTRNAQAIMTGKTMPACAQDPAFTRAYDALVGTP